MLSWFKIMRSLLAGAVLLLFSCAAFCQDNYEIQVYGSETVPPGTTMLELHSNFTISGSKNTEAGVYATEHAWHETVEITHGFNDWFETGFYIFTSASTRDGWQWVGDHIRPRVRVPESWNWPVGVSLSTEIGYQRYPYSPDTWNWEIRPIVDKKAGKWYLCVNPSLERSFHGPGVSRGVEFAPSIKVGYDLTKRINGGFEYYGGYGSLRGFDAIGEQSQQFIPSIDLDLGPKWEFNFGVGIGVTHGTDHLLIKMIMGRRFNWGSVRRKSPE